jgi:HPt (histidine-containing phosphotransfer) domain-containing protein
MNMDTSHHMQLPDDLKRRYLDRRAKDIEDCLLKLKDLDWTYFERLGHQLKGNAPSYGFDELGAIAHELEASAQEKDLDKLEMYVNAFRVWLGRQIKQ